MKNVASVSYSPLSHSEETEIYGGSLRVGVRQLIETLLHPFRMWALKSCVTLKSRLERKL